MYTITPAAKYLNIFEVNEQNIAKLLDTGLRDCVAIAESGHFMSSAGGGVTK
jgi:hypothetical protein